jgi:hypothetical protein
MPFSKNIGAVLDTRSFKPKKCEKPLPARSLGVFALPQIIAPETLHYLAQGNSVVVRPGGKLDVEKFAMRPTINWLVDPIIQRLVPTTEFYVRTGEPPALARYEGPRNYAGQEIRLE